MKSGVAQFWGNFARKRFAAPGSNSAGSAKTGRHAVAKAAATRSGSEMTASSILRAWMEIFLPNGAHA
eukprot:85572-Lingulodinium_polyedra.AAC.1